MGDSKTTKKKNVAIEFWRIFFAIAITGYHVGTIMSRSTSVGADGYWMSASNWFAGAGEILFVFTLTAGYFLVKHFKKRQAEAKYNERSASSRAWEYVWKRVKNLLPVLIFGYAIGLIAAKFYYGYEWFELLKIFVNGIWEFLGFHSVGFRGAASVMVGNGALWFISSMIIISYFMYYLLCKDEDKASGFFTPFMFIFFGGWWCFTGTRASQMGWSTIGSQIQAANGTSGAAVTGTPILGFNNGFLFVLIGICGGILIYYLVEQLKKREFKLGGKIGMTLFYILTTGLLVWYTIYPATNLELERWVVHLLCMILVTLTLLGVDSISKFLNNKVTYSVLNFLGEMALYLYMIHYPVILFVLTLAGKNTEATIYSFNQIFVPVLLISFVLGVIVKLVMDNTIMAKKE